MMPNGLNIKVSKEEFMQQPAAEQNWMLFMGIQRIDQNGCSWAQRTYKQDKLKKIYMWGAGMGAGIGVGVAVYKLIIG
jgi:hypothetical protein